MPILELAISHKDWALCDEVIRHIRTHFLQPSVGIMSSYLCALTTHHRITKAIEILEGFGASKQGVVVSREHMVDLFQAMLAVCSRLGLADDALWLSERMRLMGYRSDAKCWGLLIQALCCANRFEEALDAVQVNTNLIPLYYDS
jgi:hypothetical protein